MKLFDFCNLLYMNYQFLSKMKILIPQVKISPIHMIYLQGSLQNFLKILKVEGAENFGDKFYERRLYLE